MTRKEFELMSFDSAMEMLYQNSDVITTSEMLKAYIVVSLEKDNNNVALHILKSICEDEGDWYYYDYSAGTCCTPVSLKCADDVESLIGFEE